MECSSFKRQPSPQREIKLHTHTRRTRASTYVRETHTYDWPDILQYDAGLWTLHVHTQTHTAYNPRVSYHRVRLSVKLVNSIYMSWTWADWHRHKHTGRSIWQKLRCLRVQYRQLGTISLRHTRGREDWEEWKRKRWAKQEKVEEREGEEKISKAKKKTVKEREGMQWIQEQKT